MARQRHREWLYRSSWGVFIPTVLVLVTLASLLIFSPLFERQINSRWVAIGDVIEPSRILLGDIQAALAREMANVRAFALTDDPLFIGRYRDLLSEERRLFNDLERLTLNLSPEVIVAYDAFSGAADEWHERATEEEMLAGVLDPADYAERIASEQALWEQLLAASNGLRDALHEEETRVRAEILELERARMATTAALLLLALLAAMAAAWMGIQIQRLRLEAEHRGRELGRLIESRAHLIRGITHDVKNPLGVISGYTELLEDGILDEEASADALGRIRESSRSALRLIDDLLELSISEAGELRLEFEPLDIVEQVETAVSEHAAAAGQAGLELTKKTADSLPEVITDARRVRQVLGNLLSNAIKYTPAGGRIHVAVAPDSADGDRPGITIDVADTGPGIPEDWLEEIFEEFTRLEPGAERGTGLGLTISRRIARALGGDITVKSGDREGSTFTFRVPLVPPHERFRTASPAAGRQTMR